MIKAIEVDTADERNRRTAGSTEADVVFYCDDVECHAAVKMEVAEPLLGIRSASAWLVVAIPLTPTLFLDLLQWTFGTVQYMDLRFANVVRGGCEGYMEWPCWRA